MIVYTWSGKKRASNIAKHDGVDFNAVRGFDWSRAVVRADRRFDYGEERRIAAGFIQGRLHVLVYVEGGWWRRVISLRKANDREKRDYDKKAPN